MGPEPGNAHLPVSMQEPHQNIQASGGPPDDPAVHKRAMTCYMVFLETVKWLRRLLRGASWAYAMFLVALLLAMRWIGEGNYGIAFLLYLPPATWLLPLLILFPAALLLAPRHCLLHVGCVMAVLVLFMQPQWASPIEPTSPTFTLVSNNIGQKGRHSLRPFLEAEQPDFIVLQDARGRARRYADLYPGEPEMQVSQLRRLALVSRYPIIEAEPVELGIERSHGVAARFEVEWNETRMVIYNIHLPTPRHDLNALRWGAFITAFIPFGQEERHQAYQKAWDRRLKIAETLAGQIELETLPVILAGDFNTPGHGPVYREFASRWRDAFRVRGRGYGFTLPGQTRNPLSLFGPWLRLDYIFYSTELECVYFRTEPDRASQHRAVSARLQLAREHQTARE